LIFVAFAFATGSTNIDGMITGTSELGSMLFGTPYLLLSLLALTLVSLAVNARSPVDDSTRITDLASVRETLSLEYSGPYLAMLEYASALKFTVFTLLVANVILPWPLLSTTSSLLDIGITILATLAKLVTVTLVIAVLESTLSQLRFYRIQEFLTGAFFMSLIGLILALLSQLL
jgi:formate hydrogenlyase subunit 4